MSDEKDASISFSGVSFRSQLSAGLSTAAGSNYWTYKMETSVNIDDDNHNVSLNFSSAKKSADNGDINVSYDYIQMLPNENLIFEVKFNNGFAKDAEFEIISSDFPGFNIKRQSINNKQVNASASNVFSTTLDVLLWLSGGGFTGTEPIKLIFYKLVTGEGGIDHQVKIAETTLNLENNLEKEN